MPRVPNQLEPALSDAVCFRRYSHRFSPRYEQEQRETAGTA